MRIQKLNKKTIKNGKILIAFESKNKVTCVLT